MRLSRVKYNSNSLTNPKWIFNVCKYLNVFVYKDESDDQYD